MGFFFTTAYRSDMSKPKKRLQEVSHFPNKSRVLVPYYGYGTVMHQYWDGWLAVEFDEWFSDGHTCQGRCFKGFGEWVWPDDVEFGVAIIPDGD